MLQFSLLKYSLCKTAGGLSDWVCFLTSEICFIKKMCNNLCRIMPNFMCNTSVHYILRCQLGYKGKHVWKF